MQTAQRVPGSVGPYKHIAIGRHPGIFRKYPHKGSFWPIGKVIVTDINLLGSTVMNLKPIARASAKGIYKAAVV